MTIAHPFTVLKPEYSALLASMSIIRPDDVSATASRLLTHKSLYKPVSDKTGIPIAWIAASFEREASSDFRRSPAQGDFWNKVSTHVPAGRGPFDSWAASALDAYHLNGLDKVGYGNWSWELCCFYGELFNGMGYRDYHHMHSPYLWGGTNIQQRGKYTSDGHFDPDHFDGQLGIIPIMRRMVQMDPSLSISRTPISAPPVIPSPLPAPIGLHDAKWLQASLNHLGEQPPLDEDGSYGKHTFDAVKRFQIAYKLHVDGFAGPETAGKIVELLAALAPASQEGLPT